MYRAGKQRSPWSSFGVNCSVDPAVYTKCMLTVA